jgi:hypothetical protein
MNFLLFFTGGLFGVVLTVFGLGRHISALRWWLGDDGEHETAQQLARLGAHWYCEHDLVHARGNWDHILVGPSGVYLIESKYLHHTAAVRDDTLLSGGLSFSGSTFRVEAWRIKSELEGRLGFSPRWVQPVVVIWGSFPQKRIKEGRVVYLAADELVPWLESRPAQLASPQQLAAISGIRELRAVLGAAA